MKRHAPRTEQNVPSTRWFDVAVVVEAAALLPIVAGKGSPRWIAVRVCVVVALAAVAVWLARAGGPRRRGTLAVAVGLVGLVIGLGIGVSFTARSGLSLVGTAGLVCLVTGLALLGAGTLALVRNAHGWRRWLGLPIGFVVLQFLAVPLFGAIVVTNVPPDDLDATTPADRGLRYEEVTFRTADGIDLSAWYVPSTNRAALVFLSGSGSTRSGVLDHAVVLARHGYGSLVMDNRGHGHSQGVAMDTGWFGDLDVNAAVRFLQARPDVDPTKVGVVGLSMGGEEAIGAAGSNEQIRAVVAEGATARDSADHVSFAAGPEGWIERATSWEQFRIASLLTDASTPLPLRDAAAASAPRPMLLIAGTGEEEANRRFRDAAPERIELWEANTAHVAALPTHPAEWEQRVTAFLHRALGVDATS